MFKLKGCYSRLHFHVFDYCQWLRMPDDLICPRMPHKQIELWGIISTSGNFRPYQIQTANIHFKDLLNCDSPIHKSLKDKHIRRKSFVSLNLFKIILGKMFKTARWNLEIKQFYIFLSLLKPFHIFSCWIRCLWSV